MATDETAVTTLSAEECWEALLASSLGRIALAVGGVIDIFPVNYIAHDGVLTIRTSEGTKLIELVVNPHIAFEIDGVGREDAWSVVVKGSARILSTEAEIAAVEQLGLRPLAPTEKHVWVRIDPTSISGRRFVLGPAPDDTRSFTNV